MSFFWSMVVDAGIPFAGVLAVGCILGTIIVKNTENKEN